MTQDRKDFEDWYKENYWNFTYEGNILARYDESTDKYNHMSVNLAWQAWQAAISRQKSDLVIFQ